MTARMRSPSASASERRLRTTTPQPSPRTKPSARGVEGLAAAVGGQHAALRKRDAGFGHQDDVHAAGNGKVAIPAAQAHAGEVGGNQRRGTGGVDGEAGSLQPEHVGQAAGGDAVRHAGGVVGSR